MHQFWVLLWSLLDSLVMCAPAGWGSSMDRQLSVYYLSFKLSSSFISTMLLMEWLWMLSLSLFSESSEKFWQNKDVFLIDSIRYFHHDNANLTNIRRLLFQEVDINQPVAFYEDCESKNKNVVSISNYRRCKDKCKDDRITNITPLHYGNKFQKHMFSYFNESWNIIFNDCIK